MNAKISVFVVCVEGIIYLLLLYRQKLLREEKVAGRRTFATFSSTTIQFFTIRKFFFRSNIIFHNSHLFLPATYRLRVLMDVPRLILLTLIAVWGQFFYREVRQTQFLSRLFKFHPIRFSSLFIKYLEKLHSPRLLSIWVNSKPPVYFLPPVYQSPQSMNFGRISSLLICIHQKIGNNYKVFNHF